MVTSKIQIVNLALAKLSDGNPVQDLSENSPEAEQSAAHYDVCVQLMLRQHPWDFARRAARLALLADDPSLTGWAHLYAYPADCVAVRRVYPAAGPHLSPPFLTGRTPSGDALAVMSNQADAVAEYTVADPPAVHMPALFADSLAWLIASQIALATGRQSAGQLFQAHQMQLELAKLSDAREAGPRSRADGYWIQNRNAMPAAARSGEQ